MKRLRLRRMTGAALCVASVSAVAVIAAAPASVPVVGKVNLQGYTKTDLARESPTAPTLEAAYAALWLNQRFTTYQVEDLGRLIENIGLNQESKDKLFKRHLDLSREVVIGAEPIGSGLTNLAIKRVKPGNESLSDQDLWRAYHLLLRKLLDHQDKIIQLRCDILTAAGLKCPDASIGLNPPIWPGRP